MAKEFQECTEKINVRIKPSTRDEIKNHMKNHGMRKESQYIKLAIDNQVKTDDQTFNTEPSN